MKTFDIDIKCKKYFGNRVLKDFQLSMPYGAVVGLLGLNGTGKTTVFDCIAGLESYSGVPMMFAPGEVSYMCIRRNLFADMRIRDAVNFYADFYKGFDKNTALNDIVFTRLPLKKRVRSLSAGQYRIITFILAINCASKIYLLDEPMSNLDIVYKDFVLQKLIETINDDKLYIVASHELPDLERVFSHIAIIKDQSCTPLVAADDILSAGKSISEYYKEEISC